MKSNEEKWLKKLKQHNVPVVPVTCPPFDMYSVEIDARSEDAFRKLIDMLDDFQPRLVYENTSPDEAGSRVLGFVEHGMVHTIRL